MNIQHLTEKYRNIPEQAKASIWYTVCNILLKGIALLSTPIFTRILSEEQYGTFALFQSWFSILIIFTSLNMFQNGYSKGLILYKEDVNTFTSSLLGLTTIITLGFGLVYLMNIEFWTGFFELSPVLMGTMFIELITMPAVEFWATQKRFHYKYKEYVVVSITTVVLSLGVGVVSVLLTDYKVEARVFSDVFAKALFGISFYVLILKKGKKLYCKKYWKYSLQFNIPLIPHYLSHYVLSQSDRLMIGKMIGKSEAGMYSIAYSISTMMNLITNAINNSLVPYIYKSIDNGKEKEIKKVTSPIIILVGVLSILTMTFAPEVILVFAGKKYYDAVYVIPPIAAAVYFIFIYSLLSTIEYYFVKTGGIAVATTISALINIVTNYIFIRVFGYYAAGYTTLLCYIILVLCHFFFYRKVLKKEMKTSTNIYDIRVILLTTLIVLIFMIVMVFIYKWFIIRYCIVASIIISCYIKRKKIKLIIQTLKNRE